MSSDPRKRKALHLYSTSVQDEPDLIIATDSTTSCISSSKPIFIKHKDGTPIAQISKGMIAIY